MTIFIYFDFINKEKIVLQLTDDSAHVCKPKYEITPMKGWVQFPPITLLYQEQENHLSL